jgi:hypothetical protein
MELKPFNTAGIKPFDTRTLKPFAGASSAPQATISHAGLETHHTHARTPIRRRTFDRRHIANVAAALPGLPADGESWHMVLKGNSPLWLLLPRLLELAAPATIERLTISTLGFSTDFGHSLLQMLDEGQVGAVSIAVSTYFASTSEREFDFLAAGLATRKQTMRVCRTHAKIVAAAMTDGRRYVFEGSGNLRSCRMIEQLVVTADANLCRFHERWITRLLSEAGE